jgi:hypothetical protein
VTPSTPPSAEPGTYTFSPRELQRLAVYRAAVVAHFYTDQCETVAPAEWAHTRDATLVPGPRPEAN